MKKTCWLVMSLCCLAACSPRRPVLETHTAIDPDTMHPELFILDLDITVRNFFALQKFYLTPKSLFTRPPSEKDKEWATGIVRAEAEALNNEFPVAYQDAHGPFDPPQGAMPLHKHSFAIFDSNSERNDAIWEAARLRANFSSDISALYWARTSKKATPAEIARLEKTLEESKDAMVKGGQLLVH